MTRLVTAAALLAALMLGACQEERSNAPFDHLFFRYRSSAPSDQVVGLRENEIQLTRGIAVNARVAAIGTDGEPLDLIDLRSEDEQIFVVRDGPELGEYVFHGSAAGTTQMGVYSDGRRVGAVPVEILEQSP